MRSVIPERIKAMSISFPMQSTDRDWNREKYRKLQQRWRIFYVVEWQRIWRFIWMIWKRSCEMEARIHWYLVRYF